jgi:formate--tetrahydrofolate ligase
MLSDLQIAQQAEMRPIIEVAEEVGILREELELHGDHMAKVKLGLLDRLADKPDGKLVLVTAITPTPLGEGKTVTNIGLTQALRHIGKNAIVTIREPSMGPTFGIKGGACGGGYAQVVPMEEINLHFTGDIHAVGAANNLLAAMIGGHLWHKNPLNIDPFSISWNRVIDMNDVALRSAIVGLGGKGGGMPRETQFDITVASEVMAILALTSGLQDIREHLGRIQIGVNKDREPVTAEDLKAAGAMAVLMKDAIKPNLVQALDGRAAFVHAGPFANIAIGTNSILADKIALKLADYVTTEAGFGADCGAEKFLDIKCRVGDLEPSAVVIVATVDGEIAAVKEAAESADADAAVETNVWAEGGAGGTELAEAVVEACEQPSDFKFLYPLDASIKEKIETIATKIYGADGVEYSATAETKIRRFEKQGLGNLPICMAKTHLSLSHDPDVKGRPTGFTVPIEDIRPSVGAGFLYPLCGAVRTMPGLPTRPAAEDVDLDEEGNVVGLF